MLKVSGTVDGKQVDDVFPVDKVIAMFNLKEQIEELKKSVGFEIGEIYRSKRPDQQGNMGKLSIKSSFTADLNGSVVTVQYYEKILSKTVGDTQVKTYEPGKIHFISEVLSLSLKDKKELVVYMLLHPRNKYSPFYKNGSRWDFATKREKAVAAESIDFQRMEIAFKAQVLDDKNIADTRLRAEAMGFGNLSAHGDGEVQSLIINRYENSKTRGRTVEEKQNAAKTFIQTFNAHLSEIKGAVARAVNIGIIYGYYNQSNGKYTYEWANVSDSSLKGKTVLEVPKGADHKEAINLYFTNNSETLYPVLKKLLAENKAETAASDKKK